MLKLTNGFHLMEGNGWMGDCERIGPLPETRRNPGPDCPAWLAEVAKLRDKVAELEKAAGGN
jgi:hypothetical protein